MKKDLPENVVEGVAIAVVLEEEHVEARSWKVYVLNLRDTQIQNVLISSKGYGTINGEPVKTTIFRHFIGNLDANNFAADSNAIKTPPFFTNACNFSVAALPLMSL